MTYRLIRNAAFEALIAEDRRPTPHAPRYDVEEVAQDGQVIRLIAVGETAQRAKALIEKAHA